MHSTVLGDFRSVVTTLQKVQPRYIYNLAAQSSVGLSFDQPVETIDSIMHGTINVMESMRFLALDARFYNAASSECFGNTQHKPADETTEFRPRSPYAVGKAAAFWAVANYREAYGLFAALRHSVQPRVALALNALRHPKDRARGHGHRGRQDAQLLELGSLDLSRDWGWAPEYVDAMQRMLDYPEPADFVVATGETHSLKDFVAGCFSCFNLDWQDHVVTSDAFRRPTDILYSSGNPEKAKRLLGWSATVTMPRVVELLIQAERARRRQ